MKSKAFPSRRDFLKLFNAAGLAVGTAVASGCVPSASFVRKASGEEIPEITNSARRLCVNHHCNPILFTAEHVKELGNYYQITLSDGMTLSLLKDKIIALPEGADWKNELNSKLKERDWSQHYVDYETIKPKKEIAAIPEKFTHAIQINDHGKYQLYFTSKLEYAGEGMSKVNFPDKTSKKLFISANIFRSPRLTKDWHLFLLLTSGHFHTAQEVQDALTRIPSPSAREKIEEKEKPKEKKKDNSPNLYPEGRALAFTAYLLLGIRPQAQNVSTRKAPQAGKVGKER